MKKSAPDPRLDLAVFLAYLQSTDVRPLHGRWLSPRHFQAVGRCLAPPEVCDGQRSERKAGRIPFVHFLAESLNLVTPVGDYLKPDPSALHWLQRAPSAQMRALWEAWLSPAEENRQRWIRYRLPAYRLRDPVAFARRVINLLLAQVQARPDSRSLDELASSALDELLPWWEQQQGQSAAALLRAFLDGPLSWLRLIVRTPTRQTYRLTPLGAWLLERPDARPPADDVQPLSLSLRDEDLSIHLSDRPQLDGILALAEWAELTPGPTLRLTHASLTRALERGGSSRDLLASLTRYADPPPTPSQRQAFQTQLQQIDIVTLRPALLLQTASPAQMAELWQSRSLRSHLGRQLSPELATVETPAPQDLVQALRRKGFAVRTPVLPVLAVRPGGGAEAPLPAQPVAAAPLSSGEAYWLAAIFLVHSHLARRLGLTAVPPAAILETLAANLEPGQLAAAHTAADQALAHLDRALDGPGPFTPVLSQEEILARLEAAIQAGQTLHLRYASAARGEITEREITPRHVEWRGDRLYLVAHCHLRGAERTFRLDRILDVTPLCLSDTGQAQGGQGEG